MFKTVCITGGAGLLALNWAAQVRGSYNVVLGLHDRIVRLPGVDARILDLNAGNPLVRDLEQIRPDFVVHAAGLTNVDECERSPDLARRVNVDLAANVASACARLGIPLVHISTDHLFSGMASMMTEMDSVCPVNVYATTKADAERKVLEANAHALVVRTNFFGWGPTYRRSFSDVILDSLRRGSGMTLYSDVYYTPILIEKLVQAAHDLVDKGATGIFNVVGDERISKYEFGVRLAHEFGMDAALLRMGRIADQDSPVKRPRDMSLSNRKLCEVLGRPMGGVREHLTRLREQSNDEFVRTLQTL